MNTVKFLKKIIMCKIKIINENIRNIHQTKIWVYAIIYKGKQIIELAKLNRMNNLDDADGNFDLLKKRIENNTILKIEEHFFLVSIIKSKRWLEKIVSPDETIKTAINTFNQAIEKRNVREHDEEYYIPYSEKSKSKIKKTGGSILGSKVTIISDNHFLQPIHRSWKEILTGWFMGCTDLTGEEIGIIEGGK